MSEAIPAEKAVWRKPGEFHTFATPQPSGSGPRGTLAALALATIGIALLQSLVAPALTDIERELGSSQAGTAWVVTALLLSFSASTPIIGRLGDLYGKRRVLIAVLVVVLIGTVLAAIATSLPVLLAGRVIQGLGGGVFPLGFAIVRDQFPPARVAAALGLLSTTLGIGGALGLVLAGVIVDHLGYHYLFWLPLIVIVVSLAATVALVRESPPRGSGRPNWAAAALLSLGLTAILIGITQASTWGWGSPAVLTMFGGGGVVLAVWVRVELGARLPLVDVRIMRHRQIWATNVVGFLLGVAVFLAFVLLPRFAVTSPAMGYGFGASVTEAGLLLAPAAALMFLTGSLTGRLERRFSTRTLLIAGCVCSLGSFVALLTANHDEGSMHLATGLLGIGIGMAYAAMVNLIVRAVPSDQTGVATGVNTVARTVGSAVGAQLGASLVAGAAGSSALAGYNHAFAAGAAALAIAVVVSLAIR